MTTKNPATLDAVRTHAQTVAGIEQQLTTARAALRQAIIDADADGHSRNRIAAAAEGGLSRGKVFTTLGVYDLHSAADQALRADGYTGDDYRLTTGPSAVTLALAADAGEPDAPVTDHRDYQDGDPYWDDRLAAERREVGVRRRNLAGGILSTLARAGITAAGDVDRLLDYESVNLESA